MKTTISQRVGLCLFSVAVGLAIFQISMFDHVLATSKVGFTDEIANDTTVFNPVIDNAILCTILLLALAAVFLALKRPKRVALRATTVIAAAGVMYVVFAAVELAIQNHLSGFTGV